MNQKSIKVLSGKFIRILIFFSYHLLTQEQDYYSREVDLKIEIIKRTMPRDQHLKIKHTLFLQINKHSLKEKKLS